MYDPYANFETATLENGLTVYVLHIPERPGAHFAFGVHSGARHDLPGKEGTAHYMEHLVSRNGIISYDELNDFFTGNTGNTPMLGMTSFHSTRYAFYTSTEPESLTHSLRYFGFMLLEANLQKCIETERDVIISEFHRAYPGAYRYDLARRMHLSVFLNTFFARLPRPLGTLDSIRSLTQHDLQLFYDTHYTPANMSVVCVGSLTLADAVTYLEESPFGEHKPGARTPSIEIITNPPRPTESLEMFDEGEHLKGRSVVLYESVAQLPGTIGTVGASVFSDMLRRALFDEVRLKRSWAYAISCSRAEFPDFHMFSIASDGLMPGAMDAIDDVVTGCVESLIGNSDSFEKSREAMILKTRFADPNTKTLAKNAVNELLLKGRIIAYADDIRHAEQMTLNDIENIATWLSRERRRTLIRHP